jgi:hypothetical protein
MPVFLKGKDSNKGAAADGGHYGSPGATASPLTATRPRVAVYSSNAEPPAAAARPSGCVSFELPGRARVSRLVSLMFGGPAWRTQMISLEIVQAVASAVGAGGVVAGVYFGVRQLRLAVAQLEAAKRSQQAQTLLQFDQMLDRHQAVHKKLRPGGEWAGTEVKLEPGDWAEIERYMGLFERAKILIDDGFLDPEEFDHLYGYRVRNIRANPSIRREKLEKRAYGWRYFIELENLLEESRRRREA